MTNFEKLCSMSEDDLATWLDTYGVYDTSPWTLWFDTNYCKKCEPVKISYIEAKERLGIDLFSYEATVKCAHCELESCCKFFPNIAGIPSNLDIIKLWLKKEIEE